MGRAISWCGWCAVVAVLFGDGGRRVEAHPPLAGKISEERYTLHEERGLKIPLRDGVKLSVDLCRPAELPRAPAIVLMTPYSNNGSGTVARARYFARRGYAVALVDSRGRYDSEGTWDPFSANHKTDGYDTIEWVAKQSWCNGSVGMLGGSYLGWTQWWTATQAPPALKCIIPEVAPPDSHWNCPYQQGILVGWMMDWGAMHSGRTMQIARDGPYGGFTPTRQADFMKLPYLKLNARRGAKDCPWFETWLTQNLAGDPYWQAIAYQHPRDYSRVRVPSLSVTGWFDANYPGSPRNFVGVREHGATREAKQAKLVIGPWQHGFNTRSLGNTDFGPEAAIGWDAYCCRWFDHYLLGIDNGIDRDPAVQVFVMGRNEWRTATDWPLPETHWKKYYLHSGGHANSLRGDGTLSLEPPDKESPDQYVYDPALPTLSPYSGGHLEDGPIDTRPAARGSDVLVYSSEPLASDMEVVGPIFARLYAATSAKDTDWMLRLVDVRPDGHAAFLCDGVMRARHRDPEKEGAFNAHRLSEILPNRPYLYTLEFWRGTGNVFRKGHRIRIEISSSYYPYYLPNLNTGRDNIALETERVIARQIIFHDQTRPTHVLLPMIPKNVELADPAAEQSTKTEK